MRLRTQLLLAFLLLAVLPLAIIVLYSYVSSERAFRQGVEAEGNELAESMSQLLADSRQGVRQQVRSLGDLRLGALLASAGANRSPEAATDAALALRELRTRLAEVAPLVESLEIQPAPPAPPAAPAPGAPDAVSAPAAPAGAAPPAPGRGPTLRIRVPIPRPPPAGQSEEATKTLEDGLLQDRLLEGALAELDAAFASGEIDVAPVGTSPEVLERPPETGLLGRQIEMTVGEGDQQVQIRPRLKPEELLALSLSKVSRGRGEVPFALDRDGKLYTATPEDRQQLEQLPESLLGQPWETASTATLDGWMVVTKLVPGSGVRFGVARPVAESLEQIRKIAVRNLVFGVALVGLAFLGTVPLTARITKHLSALSRGAERIAAGDLQARVPVYSENEVGQLARTFNRMAFELSENQRRLLEQERRRQQQEMHQRLLEAENFRKTTELEEARRFQLSLLPKELPRVPGLAIAVFTETATEVGGDYYDFHAAPDGTLTVAIGDATGHGARAGTMVAVIKSLFSARGAEQAPAPFLVDAARTVKGMDLHRMAMALALVRIEGRRLVASSAGMPPALLYRAATGQVSEMLFEGMPLGGLAGFPYQTCETELATGDTLLLMTDGFPEMPDAAGHPLGYDGVAALFAQSAALPPEQVIAALSRAVEARSCGAALADDTTFVVVQVLPERAA